MKRKRAIGLMSAAPFEGEALVQGLSVKGEYRAGRLEGMDVVYAASGVGAANAASAAALMIERHAPEGIVLFGIGGAYPGKGIAVGDTVTATGETYADLGVVLDDGLYGLDRIGLALCERDGECIYNTLPVDARLLRLGLDQTGKAGAFLTVSQITGTDERALQLVARYPEAVCENMEGAAVAQACLLAGVPFLEIRGISNMVERRDTSRWDMKLAACACSGAVLGALASLGALRKGQGPR